MARPWTGFHTLDTIRRDAAQERIWFSTAVVKPYEKVEVVIVGDRDGVQCAARYSVDMNNDLLEKIEFWMGKDGPFERAVGELVLSYLDELDEADGEFLMPERVAVPESRGYQKASILWPFQLLDAS